jgi:hypothetical protein
MSDTTAREELDATPSSSSVRHKRTRSPNGQARTRITVRVGRATRELLDRRRVDEELELSELHRRALVYGLTYMPPGWPTA